MFSNLREEVAEDDAERLPSLLSELQIATPTSKGHRVSRIRGRTRPRILFPAETHVKSQQNAKWSEAEKCALVKFVQQESGGKVTHKRMEYWGRAAAFVQEESKTVHQRTGTYFSS